MTRIGITGPTGFIGTHLFHSINLFPDEFTPVPCPDEWFDNPAALRDFAASCDVIVHLAAVNRHPDPEELYQTNLRLADRLIAALDAAGATPHLLFSSSVQEALDTPYARSKREGRERLAAWARRAGATFTGLVIPNVYGPFGRPFYNSVVATFSHQLNRSETPAIDVDNDLRLIHVSEVVGEILACIRTTPAGTVDALRPVAPTAAIRVSDLLETLRGYRDTYTLGGVIPALPDKFAVNLFNTYRSFADQAAINPRPFVTHADPRGRYTELVRALGPGQTSFSTTIPGVTRGNHFHTRKVERFAVVSGEAIIRLRRIGTTEVLEFRLNGENPSFVDMPPWYTHSITNTGNTPLLTVFWVNEFYDASDSDTFFEAV